MTDTIITPSGVDADIGRLINRVADAVTHLCNVAAKLEGAGDTDPQFFDLIRAVSSSAAESAYYGRVCLKHLHQLLGTDRRSARGAPPRHQESAKDLQTATAHHPATQTDAELIAELTTSCFPDQTQQTTRDDPAPPPTTPTRSALLPPPPLPLMAQATPEVA